MNPNPPAPPLFWTLVISYPAHICILVCLSLSLLQAFHSTSVPSLPQIIQFLCQASASLPAPPSLTLTSSLSALCLGSGGKGEGTATQGWVCAYLLTQGLGSMCLGNAARQKWACAYLPAPCNTQTISTLSPQLQITGLGGLVLIPLGIQIRKIPLLWHQSPERKGHHVSNITDKAIVLSVHGPEKGHLQPRATIIWKVCSVWAWDMPSAGTTFREFGYKNPKVDSPPPQACNLTKFGQIFIWDTKGWS